MSKIEDLISPKIEVTFRGEKFMLDSGFTIEETPAITMAFGNKDVKVRAEGMKQLLKVVIKRLYPTATPQQISLVDAKYSSDLLDVFYQIDETGKSEQEEIKKVLKPEAKE